MAYGLGERGAAGEVGGLLILQYPWEVELLQEHVIHRVTRTTGRCLSQFWRRDVQDPSTGRAGVCEGPFLVHRQPCCALHWGKARQTRVLFESESESCSVMSDPLQPRGLHTPWNSPGQNTGVGSLSLLQGIFPTQGWNPGLPPLQADSLSAEPQGKSEVLCTRGPIPFTTELGASTSIYEPEKRGHRYPVHDTSPRRQATTGMAQGP